MSQNVDYLREHGPTPSDELPGRYITVADRRNGLLKLKLYGTGQHGSIKAHGNMGNNTMVAYLDEHPRRDVVRTFLDANPHLEANKDLTALVQKFGQTGDDAMQEAAREELETRGRVDRRWASTTPGNSAPDLPEEEVSTTAPITEWHEREVEGEG